MISITASTNGEGRVELSVAGQLMPTDMGRRTWEPGFLAWVSMVTGVGGLWRRHSFFHCIERKILFSPRVMDCMMLTCPSLVHALDYAHRHLAFPGNLLS